MPEPVASDPRPSHPPRSPPEPKQRVPALGVLLLVVVALVPVGCATFGGGGDTGEEAERSKHVTIRVENLNWSAVHVYVRGEGASRQSLGLVTSHDEASYEVRVAQLGPRHELRLIAEPVGERGAYVSDPILFEPGDTITWTIQQPLIHSRVMVQ